MNKRDKLFLLHIKLACEQIIKYKNQIDKAKFLIDRLYQDGIIREIGIIGEAASKISLEFRKKYNEIEWQDIIGMRNKVIHEYFGMNLEIIWKTANSDILKLLKEIKIIIEGEK